MAFLEILIGLIVVTGLFYKLIDHLRRLSYIERLSDRYVLVTGAGRGFGYDITRRLDQRGCHVFACVRNEKAAQQLREACSNRVDIIFMDVADSASIQKAYHEVETKLIQNGKDLWAVINNAGISSTCRMEWMRLEDYEKTLKVNSLGVVDVTMRFLPLLKKSRGRIVNISSGAGRNCQWFYPHYNMSKYALEAFSDCLRRTVRAYGVSVSLIEPGLFKTDMADLESLTSLYKQRWAELSPDMRNEYGQNYPDKMQRFITTMSQRASDRIEDVMQAYEHATLGLYPRDRYVVGNALKYFFLPLQRLPEWASDWILDRLMGPPRPAVLDGHQKP